MYFYGLVFAIGKPTHELKPESLSYGKQSLDGAVFLYGPFLCRSCSIGKSKRISSGNFYPVDIFVDMHRQIVRQV